MTSCGIHLLFCWPVLLNLDRLVKNKFIKIISDPEEILMMITHLGGRLRFVRQKSTLPADWSSEVGRGRSPG